MKPNNNKGHVYALLVASLPLMGCPPLPGPVIDTGDTGASVGSDLDEDGFTITDGDCDDMDETVFPGADEVCDGVDNNCDGLIDEGSIAAPTWFQDLDGDGFGNPSASLQACEAPIQYVSDNTDCDDLNGLIHPGAVDIPGDGIDQDCDGVDADVGSPCDVEITSQLSGEPGDEIVIEWQGGPLDQLQIRVFSGWGAVDYHNTIVPAGSGSYTWELPIDLDPSLDYHVYVESAHGGVPNEECWDYEPIDVQSSDCAVDFISDVSGEPGDTVELQWDVSAGQLDEVYIAVFSGWSPAQHYLTTIEINTGSLTWELPADLDPSEDHTLYIESAQSGARTGHCWGYGLLTVE